MSADQLLAMILTLGSPNIDAAAVSRTYADLAPGGSQMVAEGSEKEATTWRIEGADAMVTAGVMPRPVPGDEAEFHAQFSVGAFAGKRADTRHDSHIIVFMHGAGARSQKDALQRFTVSLAAIAQALQAPAVYWGNARATHSREFFVSEVVRAKGQIPITLWTGISFAREASGRASFLSLGVREHLGLPDLLLTAPWPQRTQALGRVFDILLYTANRGTALPDGDTVGTTATERLPVRYVASPVDPKQTVMSIDLK